MQKIQLQSKKYSFRYKKTEDEDSILLKIECWCSPKTEEFINYKRYGSKILKNIRQMTFDNISLNTYDKDYIIDLDLRESGVKFGKQSYLSCNVILFKTNSEINLEAYLDSLEILIQEDKYFTFTANKKDIIT